jgi:hypothetical protein
MQFRNLLKSFLDRCWRYDKEENCRVIHLRLEKPFQYQNPSFEDERINRSLRYDNSYYDHVEFIKLAEGNIIIEPDYLNCLRFPFTIVKASAHYPKLKPSLPRYLLSLFKSKQRIDECVLFDGQLSDNYFHFFTDVANKVIVLKEHGMLHLPFVISEKMFKKRYFQFLLNETDFFKDINWYVLKANEYIRCKKVYICAPMPYEAEYFDHLRSSLGIEHSKDLSQRIFLNRSKKSGRNIKNWEKIQSILSKYDFQVVDTAEMSFKDQFETFSKTKYLISIHGAGNTNILFTPKELHFLEICPENRIAGQYYWLSKALGIEYYDMILGGALPYTNTYPEMDFNLDPTNFESALKKMLNI